LAPQWDRFSKADKTACIAETSLDGTPSYVELQTCLEMAADASAPWRPEMTETTSSTAVMRQTVSAMPVRTGASLVLAGAMVLAVGGSAALVWERFHAGSSIG
jgi:hypothetical protein